MRGHVDSETLAAFREELLARRKARQVAAHLAHCPRCAGLDAQLAGLPALLARSPVPPMPAALTARIEVALAAEAAARAAHAPAGVAGAGTGVAAADLAGAGTAGTAPDGRGMTAGTGTSPAGPDDAHGGSAAGGTSGRGRPGGRRQVRSGRSPGWAPGRYRLALRAAAVATAVVAVVGGGYGVSRLLSGNHSFATSSGPSRAIPALKPAERTGHQTFGGAHGQASSSGAQAAPADGPAGLPLATSGTNFRHGQLVTQVRAVLARRRAEAALGPAKGSTAPVPTAAGFADMPGCVRRVAAGQHPELVDVARYDGLPAAVIVLPATQASPERVLVVGTACSATVTDMLASATLTGAG